MLRIALVGGPAAGGGDEFAGGAGASPTRGAEAGEGEGWQPRLAAFAVVDFGRRVGGAEDQ